MWTTNLELLIPIEANNVFVYIYRHLELNALFRNPRLLIIVIRHAFMIVYKFNKIIHIYNAHEKTKRSVQLKK